MSFDLGGLLYKAKETVENNPDVVDNAKDLAGQAADSDAARHGQDVIGDLARQHADELKEVAEEVREQTDAHEMPAAALIKLASGVINLQTPSPSPPAAEIIAAHPNFFANSDNVYQYRLDTSAPKTFSATTNAEWYQTCIISAKCLTKEALEYYNRNSQHAEGPFQRSKGYHWTDPILGAEDGGGDDYNDTEIRVT
ncbi:hypothetical protein LA080_002249 [Diaporthe eres]|nr:hypothetical protein LA080_002249 [Diaporthe eres]